MSGAFLVAAREQPMSSFPQGQDLYPILPIMFCLANPELMDQSAEYVNYKVATVFNGVVKVIQEQQLSSEGCPLLMMKRMMIIGKGKTAALTKSACTKVQAIQSRVLSAIQGYFQCTISQSVTSSGCAQRKIEKKEIAKAAAKDIKLHLGQHKVDKDVSKWIAGATERVYQAFGSMRNCILRTTTDLESAEFSDKIITLDENGNEVEHPEKKKFLKAVKAAEPFAGILKRGRLLSMVVE